MPGYRKMPEAASAYLHCCWPDKVCAPLTTMVLANFSLYLPITRIADVGILDRTQTQGCKVKKSCLPNCLF